MIVEWADGIRSTYDDPEFVKIIIKALLQMPTRYINFIWIQAKYIISNQTGFNGLPSHNNGILRGTLSINKELVKWWHEPNDSYGYAIFHGINWTTGSFEVVGLYT